MREKITELLAALGEGKRLYRIYHETERGYLFIEYYKKSAALRCHGWGSALGQPMDRIKSILSDPDKWHIGELNKTE